MWNPTCNPFPYFPFSCLKLSTLLTLSISVVLPSPLSSFLHPSFPPLLPPSYILVLFVVWSQSFTSFITVLLRPPSSCPTYFFLTLFYLPIRYSSPHCIAHSSTSSCLIAYLFRKEKEQKK